MIVLDERMKGKWNIYYSWCEEIEMNGYILIISGIIGAQLLSGNPMVCFHEEVKIADAVSIGTAIIDIALDNYIFNTENADITEKRWREQRIIRYSDKEGNVLRYCIQQEEKETDYYMGEGSTLIKCYDREADGISLWRQEDDFLYNIAGAANENIRIPLVQQVEFLYDRLLDEHEAGSYSSFVKLGEQLSVHNYDEYERYLVFRDKNNIQCVYSYESDAPDISAEQAMVLCAELLRELDPGLVLEEVMADDQWGYVGYKFNCRKIGEQIIENKIGTLNNTCFDGMQFVIYVYEDITDDMESGEGHTAITTRFHIFLKDKVIVEEL